jgi:hypothetical protein
VRLAAGSAAEVLLIVAMTAFPSTALAQGKAKAVQPDITSTSVNFLTNQITIQGTQLNGLGAPTVVLGPVSLAVVSASATVVVATLPNGIVPGTYPVTVTTGAKFATVDTTIGITGPQGAQGPPGAQGAQGAQGPPGPAGIALTCAPGQTLKYDNNQWNCDPAVRFVDNGDGTITDHQTGLMWEKKTPCAVDANGQAIPNWADVHCVANYYSWSTNLLNPIPNGTLFTEFLARMNTVFSTTVDGITVADSCLGGHCDWRLPNILELKTICGTPTCIDPAFPGPTIQSWYASSTTYPLNVHGELVNGIYFWSIIFANGGVTNGPKDDYMSARAVRGGR